MLNQYALKFTGQISWEGQMNGLPPFVDAYIILECDGSPGEKAFIDNTIEQQAAAFTRIQAMIVQREQGKIIDLRTTPQDRMLIPMKWIVCMVSSIHKLGAELSEGDVDGVERLKDGTTPQVN